MSKEIYISSTPHETRLAIVEKDELSEIYYERENEYTLAGSIYNGRVTRVLPGMQSAFVDVGLERDAFLYITDFMEEQGESADFEGSGDRRSPERGDRTPERNDRGSERGDRRRGDRDRRPAMDLREGSEEVPAGAPRQEAEPVFPNGSELRVDTEDNLEGFADPLAGSSEEAEEGSRRWRGRRGRRRGRGGETRASMPGGEVSESRSASVTLVTEEPEVLEELHGSAAPTNDSSEASAPVESHLGEERSRGRGRDRHRGRERSADRFEGRGRATGSTEDRDTYATEESDNVAPASRAEPFILPGESLSKYRRSDDATAAASAPEPAASVNNRSQANLVVAKPSTQIDLSVVGWDGSAILPGETLSRYRGAPGSDRQGGRTAEFNKEDQPSREMQESAASREGVSLGEQQDSTSREGRGRNRRRDRDRRSNRGRGEAGSAQKDNEEPIPTEFRSGVNSREALEPMEAVQPGITAQHEPEHEALPFGESALTRSDAPDSEQHYGANANSDREASAPAAPFTDDYEPSTDSVTSFTDGPDEALLELVEQMHEVVAVTADSTELHVGEDFHEETTEYEPGEAASVSYRVDPAGPSEYRQSGLVEDDLNIDQVRFEEGSTTGQAGAAHEFTAIQPSGEMLSELPGEVAVPGAEEDPTNPIEHETAVQSAYLGETEGAPSAAETAGADAGRAAESVQGATQAFAPGEGQLEEELLDEDEADILDISASFSDETEEETYEAGSEVGLQIGSMVRDRALDEFTSLAPAIDEDEDLDIDEEELEEDELDGSEDLQTDSSDAEEDSDQETGEPAMRFDEEGGKPAAASMGEFPEFAEEPAQREPRRDGRDGRRGEGGGRGGRDRGGRGGRDSRGAGNGRSNGGRPARHSMQTTDLPAISDLLKPGQEVLVQIAKEPIAKKGARITSHIALPGRFLVFMPTVNHIGVSRKIESDGERRRLKEVLLSEKGEASGGFIVRTAAMGASEEELRSDLRFLLNLWADIKQRSESSKSPALIYHDLNLVERILRDQVTDNFSAIWCDTETEYERVLRFLQRFQPSLMRRVKLYTKDTPLFDQFGISEEINKALRSKVWLKSGGSIVINQTEALVAIDINTGKYVGKTARLEDTIVKTNLDAIPEIVRQIRLRDLGGIIVIDFIDMDDRKNRHKVLAALEEELKNDRAPSKVLQFNDFGLVAITRKRVKQSLERTLSTTCSICAGTGMTKSPVTVCNEIYIELRKMHKQLDKGDVMLRVNPEVVKQLKSGNGKWLQEMEEIAGKTILIKSDPSLHPEQFDIH